MANEIIGYGAAAAYKIGAGSFTAIDNMIKVEHPELSVKKVRWQPLNTVRYEKSKPGAAMLGALRLTFNFTQTLMNTFIALLFDETLIWRLTHSDSASTATFTGWIEKVGVTNIDGDATAPVEVVIDVAISGAPTFA